MGDRSRWIYNIVSSPCESPCRSISSLWPYQPSEAFSLSYPHSAATLWLWLVRSFVQLEALILSILQLFYPPRGPASVELALLRSFGELLWPVRRLRPTLCEQPQTPRPSSPSRLDIWLSDYSFFYAFWTSYEMRRVKNISKFVKPPSPHYELPTVGQQRLVQTKDEED